MAQGCSMIFNPSSLRRISIAIHKESSFYEQNFSYIPFLNLTGNNFFNANRSVLIPKDSVKVSVPGLDLFNKSAIQSLKATAENPESYYLGSFTKFSIDPINIFTPVNTFTYSKFVSSYKNDSIKTVGSFSCNVMLPFNSDNYYSYFAVILWRLSVFYFVPFFINTDVPAKNLGGPLFVESFEISASAGNDVGINVQFEGGSSILPPDPYQDRITTPEGLGKIYRTAKIYDCVIVCGFNGLSSNDVETQGVYTSTEPFRQSFSIQGVNIISMNLSIKNEIELKFTGNDGVTKSLEDGAKFIASKGRTVEGTFVFTNTKNFSEYFEAGTNKELILYFGGPFYYPMQNVSIQSFKLDISADGASYEHTIKFLALLQPSVHNEYYKQSEFDINYQGLSAAIEPVIYARKPFRVV